MQLKIIRGLNVYNLINWGFTHGETFLLLDWCKVQNFWFRKRFPFLHILLLETHEFNLILFEYGVYSRVCGYNGIYVNIVEIYN